MAEGRDRLMLWRGAFSIYFCFCNSICFSINYICTFCVVSSGEAWNLVLLRNIGLKVVVAVDLSGEDIGHSEVLMLK